ncbi:MAG: protein phosphatase CheZ [Candidatus Marinimicrobia bacterium]|nr:protein phosphatase CheZ [Candidatus Neomarinimicrobiota bacterium]MCF7880553.1 protein phosphatase CheZ [Candidatus Neomarinimicrobiota bacterium]
MSDTDFNGIPSKVMQDFIQLVKSVNSMIEKFKSIRAPIVESSNSMPVATQQLDKVTAETEKATHQMLDLVEGITDRGADSIQRAKSVKKELDGNFDAAKEDLDRIVANAEQSQEDGFLIMDALQFQDITAQQINHANSILEEIEKKLLSLLELTGETFQMNSRISRHFDPEATTEGGEARQKHVDELIKSQEQARKGSNNQ